MASSTSTIARQVSMTQLSELLGVSRSTLAVWVKNGMPYLQRADRESRVQWLFDVADVVAWREQQAAVNAVGNVADLEIEEARRRKLAAEAALAELALSKARGDAVSIADVEAVWSDIVTNFRAKMLALPQRLAPIVAGETQERTIVQLLQTDVFEALNELSRYVINMDDVSNDA